MDSAKRRKTSDSGSDEDEGLTAVVDMAAFLCEPKMASRFLSYCGFADLLAFRTMNHWLKNLTGKELVHRAVQSLPVKCRFDDKQHSAGLKIRLGWQNKEQSMIEFMSEKILHRLDFDRLHGDQQKFKGALLLSGSAHSRTIDRVGTSSEQYTQRPYANYSKYGALNNYETGAAIIVEDPVSMDKAKLYMHKMLDGIIAAEGFGFSWHDKEGVEIEDLIPCLFSLLLAMPVSSLRHGYAANKERMSSIDVPHFQRIAILQFVIHDDQRIEVAFDASYDGI